MISLYVLSQYRGNVMLQVRLEQIILRVYLVIMFLISVIHSSLMEGIVRSSTGRSRLFLLWHLVFFRSAQLWLASTVSGQPTKSADTSFLKFQLSSGFSLDNRYPHNLTLQTIFVLQTPIKRILIYRYLLLFLYCSDFLTAYANLI